MDKIIKNIILAAILAVITVSCSNNPLNNKYEDTKIKMDTSMTITAYGNNAKTAVEDAFKRIDEIEKLASLQIDTSDVSRINKAAGKDFVKVSPEVLKIIKKSVEYSKLSDGAFDVTVGPIIQLWKIGTKDARVPSKQEIEDKLRLVGYEKIKIDEENSSVMLEDEGMIIDLGGIAKGYAADQAVDILVNHGITKAIVNLGGSNVFVLGTKDSNQPWSIGLQHPRKEQAGEYMGIIRETDKAISTSGDYERYFIKDGKRYHHIIDPKTGYPAESGIIADTIVIDRSVADNSMDADALSTVLFVLGPEKGLEKINGIPGVQSVIATSDNRIIMSAGMKGKIDTISEDFKL